MAGYPDPSIEWFLNGTSVSSLQDYQLMEQGKVLQIPYASKSTVGMFTCLASNTGGNLTTSLYLDLNGESFQHFRYTPIVYVNMVNI